MRTIFLDFQLEIYVRKILYIYLQAFIKTNNFAHLEFVRIKIK